MKLIKIDNFFTNICCIINNIYIRKEKLNLGFLKNLPHCHCLELKQSLKLQNN